jgi:alpha-1,2-mannosyltransferase
MSSVAANAASSPRWRGAPAVRIAEIVIFAVAPLLGLGYVFGKVIFTDLYVYAVHTYVIAADAILNGSTPYPALDDPDFVRGAAYVYPPLTAMAATPLTLVRVGVAEVIVMALLVGVVAATLAALGVRDWRCYGIALLWPPVLSAIQTGNITLFMALGAALVWRFRDQQRHAGLTLGLSLAAKLFLWPLGIWMLVTGRRRTAIWTAVVALLALAITWGAIGFAGISGYPALLRRLSQMEDEWGYSVFAVALDHGVNQALARGLWLACAAGVLTFGVVLGRRGDDRRAFIVAVAAAIAFSPVVWLHYFALLLVVVAVAETSLGPAWFVPLLMYGTAAGHVVPAIGNGTPGQTLATLTVVALTVALAVRASGAAPRTSTSTVAAASR